MIDLQCRVKIVQCVLSSLRKSDRNLSQMDLAIAILVVFFNTNLTQKALEDILSLMNFTTGYDLPKTFNQLSKFIMNAVDDEIKYDKKWYCEVCVKVYEKFEDRFKRKCTVCDSRLSMYFHFSIKHQLQRILKDSSFTENPLSTQGVLKDIFDGKIFKRIYKEEKKGPEEIFTLSLSADGVSLCEKSNLGIWPVYAVCNELPKSYRFCAENVIILGK